MWALLIGIDKYRSNTIPPLRGAVADARALQVFLQQELNVTPNHITILENESATRAAILDELRRLANDPRIQRGDPIMIFYAGHGSQAPAPIDWPAGGPRANIQLTLPYDVYCQSEGKLVAPIPDRTLRALFDDIAQEKGDNICVVMDSCYSASASTTRSSSNSVRSARLPFGYRLPTSLDEDILTSYPIFNGLQSHVLLSACGPSGQAWESNGLGVFTTALLDLFKDSDIQTLRYCDVVMRMDIDSNYSQSPYCDGFNRERCVFTSKPRIEYFIPTYTRTAKNGEIAYVLNGGAAHGLVVGDEFAIYSDMDCPDPDGSLLVDKVGPFYSVMRLVSDAVVMTGNSVAFRVKEGRRQPLRVYSRSSDKSFGIMSHLRNSSLDSSNITIVPTPEECNVDISIQDDQAIFWLKNRGNTSDIRIEANSEELPRFLKAAWGFFSELDRTADFPDITQHIEVQIYELQRSQFPVAQVLPFQTEGYTFALRQGSLYGLKMTNNSCYDLYPIVQYFDPCKEFKFETWYRPACCRSGLDVPLKKNGGFLTIGCGSGSSPPLVSSNKEGLGFLKITLFSRPLDPYYDAQSFRLARRLPEILKGPWATITKSIKHLPSKTISVNPDSQKPPRGFVIGKFTFNCAPRFLLPNYRRGKGVSSLGHALRGYPWRP